MMQERGAEPMASGQKLKTKTHQVEWCVGPVITVTDAQEADERQDVSIKPAGKYYISSLI